MRALVITGYGPPEVLKVEQRPDPVPGPGEVRVRVRAAGINFADTLARIGLYPDAPKPPTVVGYEWAGDVESVGPDVDLAPGARVIGWSRFGGQAELVVTAAAHVIPLPDGWSYEEGAAFPVNYGTAYGCLARYGALHAGERVLIQAAAGGVGIAMTQIARLVGAGDIYGTASPSKHDAIRAHGVTHAIDYRSERFDHAVRRIAGEQQPLDLVADAIGGISLRRGWALLGAGGRLVCYGASAVSAGERRSIVRGARTLLEMPVFLPLPMMSRSKSVIGFNLLSLWDRKGTLDEYIVPLREWVDSGELRPVVDSAFALDDAPAAHRHIGARRNVGKVVLTL